MELSLNQCRQLAAKGDLRDIVEELKAQPNWLTYMDAIEDLATIHAVQQGGCESGAYMPAVTYYNAGKAMREHGDDILDYIIDMTGEAPGIRESEAWSWYECRLCSTAVELWCSQFDLEGVDWD